MDNKEVDECKSCGSETLLNLESKGKEYMICEECGQVHRIK